MNRRSQAPRNPATACFARGPSSAIPRAWPRPPRSGHVFLSHPPRPGGTRRHGGHRGFTEKGPHAETPAPARRPETRRLLLAGVGGGDSFRAGHFRERGVEGLLVEAGGGVAELPLAVHEREVGQ